MERIAAGKDFEYEDVFDLAHAMHAPEVNKALKAANAKNQLKTKLAVTSIDKKIKAQLQ